MRSTTFLVGIIMIVAGPLLTLLSLSSCLGTILSGQFLACVTDFAFVVFGGLLFLVGIVTAIIGAATSEPPSVPIPSPYPVPAIALRPAQFTCKKCGKIFDSTRFFCPSCGQRPS